MATTWIIMPQTRAAVVEHLDLRNAIHIGHSTGGGEATRYVARHGKRRVAKLVLIGAVPPLMVKTAANPGGMPWRCLTECGSNSRPTARSSISISPSGPFYGFNRPGAKVSQGVIQNWWRQAMMGGAKAQYEGIKAFSETDFTEDLKSHRRADAGDARRRRSDRSHRRFAPLSAKLLRKSTLKIYPKFPHGMCTTHAEVVNPELLKFIRS